MIMNVFKTRVYRFGFYKLAREIGYRKLAVADETKHFVITGESSLREFLMI